MAGPEGLCSGDHGNLFRRSFRLPAGDDRVSRIAALRPYAFNVSPKTNWYFIAVGTDDGRTSWGEASLNGWEPVLDAILDTFHRGLVGSTVEAAHQRLKASPRSPGGLAANAITSALQQALLGLMAERQGLPLHGPLGKARRSRVAVYANINRATSDRRPVGFAATALRARSQGFDSFKLAPFDQLLPQDCASETGRKRIRHGIDCVLAVREALGPDARIMVDCHWRFDEERAIETLRALRPAKLHWLECPIAERQTNWPAMRRIRAAAKEDGVLLAAAETQIGVSSFESILGEGLYDVVMPDVKYCGGPWEMLQIAERCADADVRFSPHNPTGPICHLHSLHVAAVAPECQMLEMQFDESPLFGELIAGAGGAVQGSALQVPTATGLGVSVDEALLQGHPFQVVLPGVESLLDT
jgi:galactonate dehydratase